MILSLFARIWNFSDTRTNGGLIKVDVTTSRKDAFIWPLLILSFHTLIKKTKHIVQFFLINIFSLDKMITNLYVLGSLEVSDFIDMKLVVSLLNIDS